MTTDTDVPACAKPRGSRTATAPVAAASTTPSKSDTVIKLLLRTKGATPLELIAATDWQPHSVRAFLSGLRKKGRSIVREARKGGEFAYRIVSPVIAAAADDASGASAGAGDDPTRVATDA